MPVLEGRDVPGRHSRMTFDMASLFAEREAERYSLHTRHLNEQMVRVLKTIGYDVGFVRGQGQYLFDRGGARYLDLLSGFGVFALGRNHPTLREALKSVLDADLPNLVQMDVSVLAGILAERLLRQRALPRQGVLRQLRRRGGRGGDQVRALRHRAAAASSTASTRFHGLTLRRAVAQRRRRCSATASSRCCRTASSSRSTTSPRWSGRSPRARSPPSSSSRSRARA